jgi:hypothetical protein
MGRYDQRVKESQSLASIAVGKTLTIAGTAYPCLAGDIVLREELTDAGIKRTRTLQTDFQSADFAAVPSIGTLGTYNGVQLRLTDTQTTSAVGGVIRFDWEIR